MNGDRADPEPRSSGRSIWIIGLIGALVLVLVAAGTVLFINDDEVAAYPPDSPEAAYQAYAQAWDAGDVEAAWGALTPRAQALVPRYEFRDANRWRGEEAMRVWIDQRTGTDDRVVLHLSIESVYDGGLFGSDRYTDGSRVTLVREDGDWKIDSPLVGYHAW